jgi:hypothetical protein
MGRNPFLEWATARPSRPLLVQLRERAGALAETPPVTREHETISLSRMTSVRFRRSRASTSIGSSSGGLAGRTLERERVAVGTRVLAESSEASVETAPA